MYDITSEASFSAAHRLMNYRGPCERIHGHNWLVRTTVRCRRLNEAGIGIDFRVLREELNTILDRLDHADLNEVLEPEGLNPSSENIARYVFDKLSAGLNGPDIRVYSVQVFETPGNAATYYGESDG